MVLFHLSCRVLRCFLFCLRRGPLISFSAPLLPENRAMNFTTTSAFFRRFFCLAREFASELERVTSSIIVYFHSRTFAEMHGELDLSKLGGGSAA